MMLFARGRFSLSLVGLAMAAVAMTAGVTAQDSSSSSVSNASSAPPSSSSAPSSVAPSSSSSVAPASSSSSSSSSSALSPASTTVPSASSNFSLPSPSATASWPAGLVLQSSVPYQAPDVDWSELDLPQFTYHLANESLATRQSICNRQTSFCSTAGCAEPKATINENFCNVDTLATRCTCSKGSSNLDQSTWPVQLADCQNRANACTSACWVPTIQAQDRSQCRDRCNDTFRKSCGTPGMVSANYAVEKEGQKPSYKLIQGGNASGVARLAVGGVQMVLAAGVAVAVLGLTSLV